jgi:hypothetical protein
MWACARAVISVLRSRSAVIATATAWAVSTLAARAGAAGAGFVTGFVAGDGLLPPPCARMVSSFCFMVGSSMWATTARWVTSGSEAKTSGVVAAWMRPRSAAVCSVGACAIAVM